MPKLTQAVPKYRRHKGSGQAVVSIDGHDFYLGPYGTKASRLEYDRVITEWLTAGRRLPGTGQDITISELAIRYWDFAKRYYRKDGKPTSTLSEIRVALRPLKRLYGRTHASEFGPIAYKAVREVMVADGLTRGTINERMSDIRRMFRWAVGEELVPASIFQALDAVPGLRKGRSEARDLPPVEPVDDAVVEATLPHLSEVVADMVRFQRATGCRPGEVCALRPCDVDRSEEVWTYQPASHKTEHHGRGRTIYIGPKGQEVLRQYLLRPNEAFCFCPADSEKKRRADRHEARKTPLSCGNRPGSARTRKPKRKAGEQYTSASYRRAITRAVKKANKARLKEAKEAGIPESEVVLLEDWAPNRLRHAAGTEVRKQFGLEAAQVTLGHAKADVTQVYAERDAELARSVAAKIG